MMQELWGCSLDGRTHLECERQKDIPISKRNYLLLIFYSIQPFLIYDIISGDIFSFSLELMTGHLGFSNISIVGM